MEREHRHPILKGILIVLAIYLVVTFFVDLIGRTVKEKTKDNGVKLITEESPWYAQDKKELAAMKKQQSDIKGLTKYEKLKKGLRPEDGSDTDGDGLTDKEEIEKYKTDPLKTSTAGDLYTDGEKVKKGLGLFSKVKYNETATNDKGIKCKGVKVHPATAYGRFTEVNDITGFDDLDSRTVYKEFSLDNFDGTVSINLKELGEESVKAEDTAICVGDSYSQKTTPLKTEVKGDTISTVKPLEEGYYTLFVTNKTALNLSSKITCDAAMPSLSSNGVGGVAYTCPILDFMSGEPTIKYVDSNDKQIVRMEKEALVTMANSEKGFSANTSTKSKKIEAATKGAVDRKYSFFKRLFPFGDVVKYPDSPFQLIFSYINLDDSGKVLTDDEEDYVERNVVKTGFKVGKDTLPFGNISSPITGRGVCTGYATVTAQLFNEGHLADEKGTYYGADNKAYNWDVTRSGFGAFRKKGALHQFKDSSYAEDHTGKDGTFNKNLNSEDKNFAYVMTYYWKTGNSKLLMQMKKSRFIGYGGLLPGEKKKVVYKLADGSYSYKTVEWIKNRIKSGKIVTIGVTLGSDFSDKDYREGKCAHAISLTSYTDVGKYTVFSVYDSNFPNRDDLVFITEKKKVKTDDGRDVTSFIYKYQPTFNGKVDKNYLMTNLRSSCYYFSVINETTYEDMAIAN